MNKIITTSEAYKEARTAINTTTSCLYKVYANISELDTVAEVKNLQDFLADMIDIATTTLNKLERREKKLLYTQTYR